MNIERELKKIMPSERIRTQYIDLVSYASDAGFYHLTPKAVVLPVDEAEVASLFRFSQEHGVPMVFRTGGTSLSGQSITDGILVDLSQHWGQIRVEASGAQVRVQPGITGATVNAHLKKFSRKIGPDPSSISAAMMGGILSNNASGMCCGVAQNSYHTIRHIRFMLPNGKTFSTERDADYTRFEAECPELYRALAGLRARIAADAVLFERIRKKYRTKNTVGYSLNAFVDYDHPLDILAKLLIGAEGTLAFISEAVLNTVPDYPYKSTALLYFPDIYAACRAIVPLTDAGAMMVELMDRASLRAVEALPGMPAIVKTLPEGAAALLTEFQEDSPDALKARVDGFLATAAGLALFAEPAFTEIPAEQDFLWNVRKGLFPAVGAVRARGTTVILEDVAFPVEKLGDAIADLQELFRKYNYLNAIIFGHAKDGNLHFVVTQAFDTAAEIDRYDRFIKEVVTLVVARYDGALKAEHGTGRNMAPFVEAEWGGDAYDLMKTVKAAVDPRGLLNPGVIINEDREVHIKNLKALPAVEAEVDKCIECGFCEHKCPSRNLTTTPRRRIVVRRALQSLRAAGERANYKLLLAQYRYAGLDTCAVDGLCATACPVDINTGALVKRLRSENHSTWSRSVALWVAKNFNTVEKAVRMALKAGFAFNAVVGEKAMHRLTSGIRTLIPAFPLWPASMPVPSAYGSLKNTSPGNNPGTSDTVVYFPACISRMLGTYSGKSKNLAETFLSVAAKAGFAVKIPDSAGATCCSQIFSSKGFPEAQAYAANRAVERLWEASAEGRYPVVLDVSSCAYTLQLARPVLEPANQQRFDRLRILDSVDFLHDLVLPRVNVRTQKARIALHPTCGLYKMKTAGKFIDLARHFAVSVVVPQSAGCCGMAGDRGFLFPELTASATAAEAGELRGEQFDGYYSSTKTCEMALSEAVQANYESILFLVDEGI